MSYLTRMHAGSHQQGLRLREQVFTLGGGWGGQ